MALLQAAIVRRRGAEPGGLAIACLLFGCCVGGTPAGAAADVTPGSVAASASQPRVAQFVVRFRPGHAGLENGRVGGPLLEELQALLGRSLTVTPTASRGNHTLQLAHPVDVAEARRLLGQLRMRSDVVYAELAPGERAQTPVAPATASEGKARPTISRLIVIFADPSLALASQHSEKPGAGWDERLSASAGVPVRVARPTVAGAWVVELLGAVDVATAEAFAARWEADGIARLAAPDYVLAATLVPNDRAYAQNRQWNLFTPGVQPFAGIDAVRAWDITVGSGNTVIAVIDSGITSHPDLDARVLAGYNFISDTVSAGNAVGRSADAADLGDWRDAGVCPAPFDTAASSSWHGTLVTGIVGATTDNQIGMAGIDWRARLLPVRVLGKCGATTLDWMEGMSWALGLPVAGIPTNPHPANIVNLSFGSTHACSPLTQEFFDIALDSGAFIAAAAGNDNSDAAGHFPSNCLGLSAVGATDPYGMRASYSNFGQAVHISAPGGDRTRYGDAGGIYSTWNSGTTVAGLSTYAIASGTSLAAPQVAGVASLMLAVNPNLTPGQIKQLMADTATPFPAGSDCLTGTCGAGIVNAHAAVLAAQTAKAAPPGNYEGLWWNAPAGSESGWGINFAHQGDVIFATWFTYDASGKAWWLSMTANQIGDHTFSGKLYETHGPTFGAVPFAPAAVAATEVGTGLLTFSDANNGVFDYTVGRIKQAKAITREVFGPLPTCTWGAQPNQALATNFQDLWWVAPAGVESGWGVNFTHQGDVIFATWFTYDVDGTPLWLTATLTKTQPGAYGGTLYRTTGPAFNAVPFDPKSVRLTSVGTLTVAFADGNRATFTYSVALSGSTAAITQTKQLTRQVFRTPGTVCQ
jgi:serine protease